MRYTDQEDEAIRQYVQRVSKDEYAISGNRLWKEMEEKKITNRSWGSMRDRYLKHIRQLPDTTVPHSGDEIYMNVDVCPPPGFIQSGRISTTSSGSSRSTTRNNQTITAYDSDDSDGENMQNVSGAGEVPTNDGNDSDGEITQNVSDAGEIPTNDGDDSDGEITQSGAGEILEEPDGHDSGVDHGNRNGQEDMHGHDGNSSNGDDHEMDWDDTHDGGTSDHGGAHGVHGDVTSSSEHPQSKRISATSCSSASPSVGGNDAATIDLGDIQIDRVEFRTFIREYLQGMHRDESGRNSGSGEVDNESCHSDTISDTHDVEVASDDDERLSEFDYNLLSVAGTVNDEASGKKNNSGDQDVDLAAVVNEISPACLSVFDMAHTISSRHMATLPEIFYVLFRTSASLEDSLDYFENGWTKNFWSREDDKIILSQNAEAIEQLSNERGIEQLKSRISFLQSLSDNDHSSSDEE